MIEPAPPRAWGRIALIVALVLSLFLNALAIGAWVRLRDARADLFGPEAAAARLPEELRQDLRSALRAEAHTIRPLLRDVVTARAAIVAAAKARPYDRASADAAMTGFRTATDAFLSEVQRVFLDQLDDRVAREK
jgi:uncharacterized membrane protein